MDLERRQVARVGASVVLKLSGHAMRAGARIALVQPVVRGVAIGFQVPDGAGGTIRFDGTAEPRGRISGLATSGDGRRAPFEGVRY